MAARRLCNDLVCSDLGRFSRHHSGETAKAVDPPGLHRDPLRRGAGAELGHFLCRISIAGTPSICHHLSARMRIAPVLFPVDVEGKGKSAPVRTDEPFEQTYPGMKLDTE